MAEDGSSTTDYRNLHELRVIDLKRELEKRGLSKSGSKKELIDRLKTQLKIEELREKSKTASEGAQVPSIQLLEGGQNEFVKSYLQQREKLFEQQMEQKKKYEEEASRSQESESQSETDDGSKPEKTTPEADKLLSVAKQSFESAEKMFVGRADTETMEDDITERKTTEDAVTMNVKSDATVELHRRSRSHSGSSSSESSSATSPVHERSYSDLRASRSRSPSVEEGHLQSTSPVRKKEYCTKSIKNSSANISSKELQQSRSNSSSGSTSMAEEQKKQQSADAKLHSDHSRRQHTDSESSNHSSTGQKDLRSCSASSSSSPGSPGSQQPNEESMKHRRQSNSLSGSSTDVEGNEQQDTALLEKSTSFEFKEDKWALDERPTVVSDNFTIVLEEDTDVDSSEDKLNPASDASLFLQVDAKEDHKNNDKAHPEVENIQETLKDQVTLSRLQLENEDKAEESEIRPTRKRRWGSTTLKNITSQPSTNISTESLKALIPEMKVDVILTDLLPELENQSPEEQNQKDSQPMDVTEVAEADKEKDSFGNQQDQLASKRKVVYKGLELTKQKSQESAKLRRTIFQAVKSGDESNDQDIENVVEEVVVLQAPVESDTLNESAEKKFVEENNAKKVESRRVSRPQIPLIPVDDPQPVGRRSPSPARNSATSIVHIHRLVRPYTLGQLKELLSQTGTIVEGGFWIDKIKSHCLVVYSTVDEAVATRRLLHGKRWPLSNPNILRVEYSTQEEFDMFKNAKDGVEPTKPGIRQEVREKQHAEKTQPVVDRDKEHERKEPVKSSTREGQLKIKERSPPVREWDRDKIRQSRSRSRDRNRREEKVADRRTRTGGGDHKDQNRDRSREERRKRRASSPERKEKKEKVETEPPAKLLDDLFRKTKAVPCIYWLPLTEEQIVQKLAMQQQAEAEREQRKMEREQQQIGDEQRGAKEEQVPKENKREDRHPDRRERMSAGRQRDPSESKMAASASSSRGDRTTTRR